MSHVHQTAQSGFKQGSHYDSFRPSYADELINHVVENLSISEDKAVQYDVLELGAGTGLFTRCILSSLSKDVKYLATDPSEGFLSVLRDKSPNLNTTVCSASGIPLPDCSVQNVICAQCFHWFATQESLKEITRVLVPGGKLIFVWNNKKYESEWISKYEEILTLYYDGTPRKITEQWKQVIKAFKGLKFIEHVFLPGCDSLKGNKQFILGYFLSISVIAQLGEVAKADAMGRVHGLLEEYFKDDEEIEIPFESEYYCVEKMA